MLRTEFCITGESNVLLKCEIFLALAVYNHIFFPEPSRVGPGFPFIHPQSHC